MTDIKEATEAELYAELTERKRAATRQREEAIGLPPSLQCGAMTLYRSAGELAFVGRINNGLVHGEVTVFRYATGTGTWNGHVFIESDYDTDASVKLAEVEGHARPEAAAAALAGVFVVVAAWLLEQANTMKGTA